MKTMKRQHRWLLPAVLILFILEALTLPVVVRYTYAGRSEKPEHVLTYVPHVLTWDKDTKVRPDGTGELSLFSTVYGNVNFDDGAKVLAPGTEGDNLIRLVNNGNGPISYTAILYEIRSTGNLPVSAKLTGDGTDAARYGLPEGVRQEDVVRALQGTLESGRIADFEIDWYWLYEESVSQDEIDTMFGNNAAWGDAEDVLMGIYVVVEDDGQIIPPDPPKTGDAGMLYGYLTLFGISFIALIVLYVDRKRESARE